MGGPSRVRKGVTGPVHRFSKEHKEWKKTFRDSKFDIFKSITKYFIYKNTLFMLSEL